MDVEYNSFRRYYYIYYKRK